MVVTWRFPVWLRWLAGLVVLGLTAFALAWFVRKPVAERLANAWCLRNNLTCQFEFEHLGFDKIALAAIKVDGPGAGGLLQAEKFVLRLDWRHFMRPALASVRLQSPYVQLAHDGERVTFDGLGVPFFTAGRDDRTQTYPEGTLPALRQALAGLPALEIENGILEVTTPAGLLTARFSTMGEMGREGMLALIVQPAELSSGGRTIHVKSGTIALRTTPSRLDGQVILHIARAHWDGVDIKAVHVDATLSQTARDQIPVVNWRVQAEHLTQTAAWTLAGLEASGDVLFSESVQGQHTISEFKARSTARQLGGFSGSTGMARFECTARKTPDGLVRAGFETVIENPALPDGMARQISVGWDGFVEPETGHIQGNGQFVLKEASASPSWQNRLAAMLKPTGMAAGHIKAARTALVRGSQDFSVGARYETDIRSVSDWQIVIPETLALTAQSGLSLVLTLTQPTDGAVMITPDKIMASGFLALTDPNLPVLKADLQTFMAAPRRLTVQTGGLSVAPWSVGGISLAADFNRLSYIQSQTATQAEIVGEVSAFVDLKGLNISDMRLFGGVRAARGPEGWRVQALNEGDCLGLDVRGLRIGPLLSFGNLHLPLCPQDGRFMRHGKDGINGTLDLGDITVPSAFKPFAGVARFADARVHWSFGQVPTLTFMAGAFHLPLTNDQSDLTIGVHGPRMALTFTDQPRLNAHFGHATVSGPMIPADITIRETRFDTIMAAPGMTGEVRLIGASMRDPGPDPVYHTLTGDFHADFDGTQITLSGPIGLADKPTMTLADIALNMDIAQPDGQISIQSRDLVFTADGLQPKHISDRMRGLFSNSRGLLKARADFTITPDGLVGTGVFSAENFGFDTHGLGAIDGVSGTIRLSDILSLTTYPQQNITIAALNPGIALTDGRVTFQVRDGREIDLESAIWPFAGGTLAVEPVRWTFPETDMRLNIDMNAIDLASLIEALALPDIKADGGVVSGRLPLRLQGGNAIIDKARLMAEPGGGVLQYTGNAANALSDTGMAAIAFNALQDFHFSVLEIEINGNLIGNIIARLVLLGHNPDIWNATPFKFDIRVDSNLAELVRAGYKSGDASALIEIATQDP